MQKWETNCECTLIQKTKKTKQNKKIESDLIRYQQGTD